MPADSASRALFVTAVAAAVVGFCSLLPHLRNETFAPVLLDSGRNDADPPLAVGVQGDVTYPGLYTMGRAATLGDVLDLTGSCSHPATVTIVVADSPAGASPASQKVDLNHADAWLLEALPGIGPDRANAIVDFRLERGPFARTEELMLVPGIGAETYETLKEYVTVSW